MDVQRTRINAAKYFILSLIKWGCMTDSTTFRQVRFQLAPPSDATCLTISAVRRTFQARVSLATFIILSTVAVRGKNLFSRHS